MKNEIPELIPDKQFEILIQKQFLHKVNLRNFVIRRDYSRMRLTMTEDQVIRKLKKQYPKLMYSTIIDYVH